MNGLANVTSKGELADLNGRVDKVSGIKTINLNLTIDKFHQKKETTGILRVYFFSELSSCQISLKNLKTGNLLVLRTRPGSASINSPGNSLFLAEVNPTQEKFIQDSLLTGDIEVRWNIEFVGLIEYSRPLNNIALGQIFITNESIKPGKVSQGEFLEKIWKGLSSEERFLLNVAKAGINGFSVTEQELTEWHERAVSSAEITWEAVKKLETSTGKIDYVTIARQLKAALDKLSKLTEDHNNVLSEIMFSNLFTGSGHKIASDGMMEGLTKILEGLTKISNQIGHTATENAKPFSYSGDRETTSTFLFITNLLLQYIDHAVTS
jgi:hypothetical protein